jgi:hypothetical protein
MLRALRGAVDSPLALLSGGNDKSCSFSLLHHATPLLDVGEEGAAELAWLSSQTGPASPWREA